MPAAVRVWDCIANCDDLILQREDRMTVAERIYDASTREDHAAARLAEIVARRIEDDIAAQDLPPGDALGSLRDLSRRYAAGMAATREAAVLLERRGLGWYSPC
jgi:DNA-binding GntR family transcriptional regulator